MLLLFILSLSLKRGKNKHMKSLKIKIGVLFVFLSFVTLIALNPAPALAATKTWTGTSGDHKFSTSGNWSPSGAPSNGDDLVFPNGVSDLAPDNDISSLSVAGITFSGSGSSGYSISGNSFTSTAGITFTTTGSSTSTIVSTPIVFSGNQTISTNSLSTLFLTGAVSGSGNITKSGTGFLGLGANNSSFSGTMTVSAGTLQIEHANALGTTGAGTTVASGASFLACFTANTTIAEPITVSGNGTGTLGALHVAGCGGGGNLNNIITFSGNIALGANTQVAGSNADTLKITGDLSGNFTLTMQDGMNATLVIDSSNNTSLTPNGTYSSGLKTTTINAGDDQPGVDVSIAPNNIYIINGIRGAITVLQGGTLKGTGTVGSISSNGTVEPGTSPGCLTSGDVILGGTFAVEIGGTTVCSEYDQLRVTGTVALSGTLSTSLLDFTPSKDQVFTIIDNDGSDAVIDTFSGLAEGATFELDGYVFRVSYVGGSGNDVTLTVVSVPDVPATGLKLVTGNPIVTTLIGVLAATGIVVAGRKLFA